MRMPASVTASGGMKTARAGSTGPFRVRLPPQPASTKHSSAGEAVGWSIGASQSLWHLRNVFPELLVYTRRQESAVHSDALASDETSRIRRQQHGRADQFLRLSEARHRSAQFQFAAALGAVEKLRVQ